MGSVEVRILSCRAPPTPGKSPFRPPTAAMNFDHFRYTLRAIVFDWLRMPDKSAEAYVESFRANPRDVRAARSIAWIHARKKRWAAAADWFDKALALEPEHADTWYNLGYAREQLGNPEGGLVALRRAVELNPKHDLAWYGIGMMHAHQGDHAAAAEALEQAATLQPMNGVAWYALGMARYHNNQPDKVEAVIRHLVDYEPQTAKRLIHDAQRSDLQDLVAHLPGR
ncbi:MAG: tetratricopeptide repeat protein [bacterium]|nr:MAG: tetratricopeptide repeat protein [bacterium]KAF0150278.1 MAG: tetratricopeptide repeat protein [bacterium]KAF0169758.1 MAG: tetratricopeptide repeat protein [bacterium]TXT20596.1 MAG: tetratricopeptide repeat protein [bacterium]